MKVFFKIEEHISSVDTVYTLSMNKGGPGPFKVEVLLDYDELMYLYKLIKKYKD